MKKLLILSSILSSLFGNSQCNLLQYGNLDFAETCGDYFLHSNGWTWKAASGTPDKYCWDFANPTDQPISGIPFENLAQPTVVCSVWNNDDSNLGFMGLAATENNSYAEYARGEFVSALLPGVYNITFKAKILSRQITYGTGPIEFTTTYPIKIRVGTSSQALGNTTNNELSFSNTISSGFISYTEDCEWQSISLVLNNSLPSQQYFYIGIDESTMTQAGSIQYVLIDDIIVTQESDFQFSADVFCTNEDIDPSNLFGVDVISAESGGVDINDLQVGAHD